MENDLSQSDHRELTSLRDIISGQSSHWLSGISLILEAAGITDHPGDFSLSSALVGESSLAARLGHTRLSDFVSNSASENGLELDSEYFSVVLNAAEIADKYALKDSDFPPHKTIEADDQVSEALGRPARSEREWHSTYSKLCVEKLQHELKQTLLQLKEVEENSTELTNKYEAAKTNLETAREELSSSVPKEQYDKTVEEKDRIENALADITQDRFACLKKIDALKTELSSTISALNDASEKLEASHKDQDKIKLSYTMLEDHNAQLDSRIQGLVGELQAESSNLKETKLQLLNAGRESDSLRSQLDELEARIKNEVSKSTELHDSLEKTTRDLEDAQHRLQAQTENNESIQNELFLSKEYSENLEKEISQLKSALVVSQEISSNAETKRLKATISGLEAQLDSAKSRIEVLQSLISGDSTNTPDGNEGSLERVRELEEALEDSQGRIHSLEEQLSEYSNGHRDDPDSMALANENVALRKENTFLRTVISQYANGVRYIAEERDSHARHADLLRSLVTKSLHRHSVSVQLHSHRRAYIRQLHSKLRQSSQPTVPNVVSSQTRPLRIGAKRKDNSASIHLMQVSR